MTGGLGRESAVARAAKMAGGPPHLLRWRHTTGLLETTIMRLPVRFGAALTAVMILVGIWVTVAPILAQAPSPAMAPAIPTPAFAPADLCRVVSIIDGDTLIVDRGGAHERVRLLGVDTPEVHDPREPVQFYGAEASAFLSNLLTGEDVYVIAERPGAVDRYGRALAHIYRAPDGLWVNLELVRQGYAKVYSGEAFQDIDLFLTYQKRARETGKGLWDQAGQVERDRTRQPAAAPARTPSIPPPAPPAENVKPATQKVTVYVTRTGSKYHRGSCSYLRQSRIPMDLEEAKRRYGPCSRCSPPT